MILSQSERLILYNQYEILKQFTKDKHDIKHYEAVQTALESGYTRNYDIFCRHIREEELESEKMNYVYDVLDMYRLLSDSFDELHAPEKELIHSLDISFLGFDGNEESEYLGYADFIINSLGAYSENKRPDLNSHAPTLWRYDKMLSQLREITEDATYRLLTLSEIKQVIKR